MASSMARFGEVESQAHFPFDISTFGSVAPTLGINLLGCPGFDTSPNTPTSSDSFATIDWNDWGGLFILNEQQFVEANPQKRLAKTRGRGGRQLSESQRELKKAKNRVAAAKCRRKQQQEREELKNSIAFAFGDAAAANQKLASVTQELTSANRELVYVKKELEALRELVVARVES